MNTISLLSDDEDERPVAPPPLHHTLRQRPRVTYNDEQQYINMGALPPKKEKKQVLDAANALDANKQKKTQKSKATTSAASSSGSAASSSSGAAAVPVDALSQV